MPFAQNLRACLLGGAMLAVSTSAHAAVHLVQIEQIIGGVNGNTTAQAIQLRMRSAGQSQMQFARLRAWDAAGANPVVLIDMASPVAVGTGGSRVLIASASFATSPSVAPDFVMANTIPASYLAAGSLTFEDDGGGVFWRVCWGGAGYTGSTLVAELGNDADGNVAPPFGGALPSTTLQSLRFPGTAVAASTNNAADYAVSARGATMINNAGASGVVVPPAAMCVGDIEPNSAVDTDDLLALLGSWGSCTACPATPCAADIATPANCAVDTDDLLAMLGNWGRCD